MDLNAPQNLTLPVVRETIADFRMVCYYQRQTKSNKTKARQQERYTMTTINWNEIWRNTDDAKERSNNLEFWDNYAPRFRKKLTEPDPYIEKFYEYMGAETGDTLFDMGCGPGTLAIPFARKGHEVFAADFSSEMLKYLMEGAKEEGVADKIHPIQLNWNEDWSERNLPQCDIAFSSRSFISRDLTSSLEKLESVARRKVCIGAWDSPAPSYDRHLAKAIGYERPGISVYYMIMGELMDRDVFPELKFIFTPFRLSKFESREAAEEQLRAAFSHMTAEQEELFNTYLEEHLFFNPEKGRYYGRELDGFWQFDHDETSSIAFISWNIETVYG